MKKIMIFSLVMLLAIIGSQAYINLPKPISLPPPFWLNHSIVTVGNVSYINVTVFDSKQITDIYIIESLSTQSGVVLKELNRQKIHPFSTTTTIELEYRRYDCEYHRYLIIVFGQTGANNQYEIVRNGSC